MKAGHSAAFGEREPLATVLFVSEPDRGLCRMMEALEKAGYRVVSAAPEDALTLARAEQPDVVIVDGSGDPVEPWLEVVRRLRSEWSAGVPYLCAFSIKAASAEVLQVWEAGADAYLCKPYTPAELLVWLKRTLSGDAGSEACIRV